MLISSILIGNKFAYASAADGWTSGVSPKYSLTSSNWVKASDISGTSIMTRLRNSYSYKRRMPKLVGLTYRQEKIFVSNTGRHYAAMTTAYVGDTTTLGFTRWYDSPYGVLLDYLSPYSNAAEQSIPGGETASTDINGDIQQYNKIQFPNGSKTIYMASNSGNLSDAKIASSVMATNNEHIPIVIGNVDGNNKQFESRAFVHASEMKARDIIMLGGTYIISASSGLTSDYNVVRVGGNNREETETYLKDLPTQTKNPKSYAGDSNGVVIQGLSAGGTKNYVNTQLVSLSQTQNMTYFYNAVNRVLNDFGNIGSAPSRGQSPSLILGVNNGSFETYWICYFYGKTQGRTVYQYVLPNYFPKIALSKNPTSWTNGNVTITANFTTYGGATVSSKKWASGKQSVSYFSSNGASISDKSFVATSNGTYTVYVKDSYGNEVVNYISVTNIDKTAPSITLTPSTTAWTNQNVTITAAITEADSGVSVKKWASGSQNASYFASSGTTLASDNKFTVSSNATYTVYVKDAAGNETVKTINVTNIDKTAPTITLTPSTTNWTNQNVTVTVAITEAQSGISVQKWASGNQNISYFATSGTALPTSNSFLATSNSVYTIYVKDNVGNETIKTLNITNIDKTAPTITLTPSTTNWTNQNVTVTANITENSSGISVKKWASGNRPVGYFADGGTALASNNQFSASSNSVYTVYVKDIAGNEVVKTIEISNIDKVLPSITLTPSTTEWTNKDIVITANIADNLSGIKLKKWAAGNRDLAYFTSSGTTLTQSTFVATSNSVYTVYTEDLAGNKIVKTITISKIDKVSPNITGDFDNTWFKGSKTISFIAQDDLSGVKSLKLWNNDKTTVLKDGTVANNIGNLSHTITTQGITYYKIASIDNVSNEKVQDVTVRIDNTAPTSSIVVPSTTNTRTINVTLNSITDVHSGIKEVWVSEKADFSSGVTKVALTGLTTKKFDFTLEAKSTIKDNFTDRNVYIRLYDNVGNYTNYTKVVKLIPANPDIPVIKIPLDNDIYVNGEKVVLNWTYNSVNSDVGRLPQLKAEIELKHKGGGSNGSDKIYNFVLNGDIFEYDFNNLEVGTYEVKVKVYNFLEPSVFRESAVRTFRYNDFKEDGNVFTKNIELSSPIKYISVLTTYDIPNGSSIEGRIYYETLSSGEFNTAKYKTFTLTKNHDATNIMVLPNRVTKIKAEYKLRRSPTDKYMSPIIDDITILAK